MENSLSQPDARWTWDDRTHPQVMGILDMPSGDLGWCDGVENAPTDALVGKVLCVCVGMAIAREVVSAELGGTDTFGKAMEPLDLLDQWVDRPTDERFQRICALLFDKKHGWATDFDGHGVVWWALRVATSSVGNFEAGWALHNVCSAAIESHFSDTGLREIAKRELVSRMERAWIKPAASQSPSE
jgi:hypothetical protein